MRDPSRVAELVPHASHRDDPAFAELPAQVPDVDVDDVGTRVVVVPPHGGQELLPGQDLARVPEERFGQRELTGRELLGASPDLQLPAAEVERGVSDPKYR